MDMDFASKTLGNAALTTGIIGTSLGALNAIGGLGALAGMGTGATTGGTVVNNNPAVAPSTSVPGCGCGWGDSVPVNRYEFNTAQGYIREIENKNTEIAYLRAEKYADQVGLGVYKDIVSMIKDERNSNDARFAAINQQLGAQAVMNQANKDSFQIMQERMDCCKNELKEAIDHERDERKCADNTLVAYMNGTFYPKMVADITTATTTVAQTLYNPLPSCGCGC